MIGKSVRTVSVFIILIFQFGGTAEADSHSACLGQSGQMGVKNCKGNSGKTSQDNRSKL